MGTNRHELYIEYEELQDLIRFHIHQALFKPSEPPFIKATIMTLFKEGHPAYDKTLIIPLQMKWILAA